MHGKITKPLKFSTCNIPEPIESMPSPQLKVARIFTKAEFLNSGNNIKGRGFKQLKFLSGRCLSLCTKGVSFRGDGDINIYSKP